MWPSLTRVTAKPKTDRNIRIPLVSTDGDEADYGPSLTVEDLTEEMALSLFTSPDGAVDDRDLEALEAWLDDDSDAPWLPSSSVSTNLSSTPKPRVDNGFDDDFADFVSAPRLNSLPNPSSIDVDGQQNVYDNLPPPPHIAQQQDPDSIPISPEITSASHPDFLPFPSSSQPQPPSTQNLEEGGAGTFDLSQVLSALQAMKEEIAGISDEGERRKAAARAALGLVAGLELDGGVEVEDEGSELGEEITVE